MKKEYGSPEAALKEAGAGIFLSEHIQKKIVNNCKREKNKLENSYSSKRRIGSGTALTAAFAILFSLMMVIAVSSLRNTENKTGIDKGEDPISVEQTEKLFADTPDIEEPETEKAFDNREMSSVLQGGTGGTGGCMVHDISYHSYLPEFIEFAGQGKFEKWLNETEGTYDYSVDSCPYPESNIYEFVRYFDYPKEEFIKVFNSNYGYYYSNSWDIDLLYGGTAEENSRYYEYVRNDILGSAAKNNFWAAKAIIISKYCDFLSERFGNSVGMNDVSFAEAIRIIGLSEANTEELINAVTENLSGDYASTYNYDYDLIFRNDELDELIENHSVFYIDLLFCGLEPRELPYVGN